MRRRLSIRDPSGALIGVVTGPFFRPWTFELRFGTSEDAPIAATVQRRWGGIMRDLFMDAETFALMLPGNGDLALARIALATAILVDCCYFEHSYAVDEAAPAAGLLSIAWRIARGLMSR